MVRRKLTCVGARGCNVYTCICVSLYMYYTAMQQPYSTPLEINNAYMGENASIYHLQIGRLSDRSSFDGKNAALKY